MSHFPSYEEPIGRVHRWLDQVDCSGHPTRPSDRTSPSRCPHEKGRTTGANPLTLASEALNEKGNPNRQRARRHPRGHRDPQQDLPARWARPSVDSSILSPSDADAKSHGAGHTRKHKRHQERTEQAPVVQTHRRKDRQHGSSSAHSIASFEPPPEAHEEPQPRFQKRPRHKTHEDRYESKRGSHSRKSRAEQAIESKKREHSPKRRTRQKKSHDAAENFTSDAILADRVSLYPQPGLFSNGRTSSTRPVGDLDFAGMKFLQKPRELAQKKAQNASRSRERRREQLFREQISAFFPKPSAPIERRSGQQRFSTDAEDHIPSPNYRSTSESRFHGVAFRESRSSSIDIAARYAALRTDTARPSSPPRAPNLPHPNPRQDSSTAVQDRSSGSMRSALVKTGVFDTLTIQRPPTPPKEHAQYRDVACGNSPPRPVTISHDSEDHGAVRIQEQKTGPEYRDQGVMATDEAILARPRSPKSKLVAQLDQAAARAFPLPSVSPGPPPEHPPPMNIDPRSSSKAWSTLPTDIPTLETPREKPDTTMVDFISDLETQVLGRPAPGPSPSPRFGTIRHQYRTEDANFEQRPISLGKFVTGTPSMDFGSDGSQRNVFPGAYAGTRSIDNESGWNDNYTADTTDSLGLRSSIGGLRRARAPSRQSQRFDQEDGEFSTYRFWTTNPFT